MWFNSQIYSVILNESHNRISQDKMFNYSLMSFIYKICLIMHTELSYISWIEDAWLVFKSNLHSNHFRNYTAVKTWMFWANVAKFDDQWIHLVLNYIGPIFQEGVQAFSDGTLRSSNQGIGFGTQTPGDGRVVVGRRYVSRNDDYAQVEVDELVFFNRALLEEEVRELYNVYQWKWAISTDSLPSVSTNL